MAMRLMPKCELECMEMPMPNTSHIRAEEAVARRPPQ